MKYEELITQLCEVIKESENDAEQIFSNTEDIGSMIDELEIPLYKKEKMTNLISNIYGLLQHQDLHRQKIERVVNYVCEKNDIDKSQYNLAPSAKMIEKTEDTLSDEELETLIKQMQQ
ncbi:hypothetical protein N5915_10115 [Arcobacter lacus]|jgi:hypothetical protein|uniref:Uncharacterized protein n=1 Tax=Arcobacter lacus TaxID=1912876 RepID=A0ABX5JJW5_9BACT|nr:hypothetical protein [Arcobacter lacus]MCT7909909.1 hypothetical protein [Arcobacter lacus]MCT7911724.1 hypothetical protein [Arcobacter lacus]PUE67442.1 hypothetical protein B0175_00215 [Arcobacter lacus]